MSKKTSRLLVWLIICFWILQCKPLSMLTTSCQAHREQFDNGPANPFTSPSLPFPALALSFPSPLQWCSKALRGPGSTVSWGPSVASAHGLKLEARRAKSAGGVLERAWYRALEQCKLALWGDPQPPTVLMFLCSQMTSPAIENPACTVQMCHFTHFCPSCKSDSSIAGLDHHSQPMQKQR